MKNAVSRIGDFVGRNAKCLLLCFLAAALSAGLARCANAQINMPVEVIGLAPYTTSETFTLTTAAGIDSIYMQVNNHMYQHIRADTKMRIRVNGGDWIPLTDTTVVCVFPESHYDCIGGARETIRFNVPLAGWDATFVAGSNTMDFQYYVGDNNSSGWRLIDIKIKANGVDRLGPEDLVWDDPSTWTYDSGLVAAGAAIFHAEDILVAYPGGPSIHSSCQSCHHKNGRDLYNFAMSDTVIVTRTVFHGLSVSDGQKLAAYIRSLSVSEGHAPVGRPWSPWFQPWPGADDATIDEWWGGGGLAYVFDDDNQSHPYLVAQFDSLVGIYGVDITRGLFNYRTFPQAFMLEDANSWAPQIGPKDLTGSFDGSPWDVCMNMDLPALLDTSPTPQVGAQKFAECWEKSPNLSPPADEELAALEIQAWRQYRLLRIMDLHFEYDLWELQDDAFPPVPGDGRQHGDIRGTLGLYPAAWSLAPHRIKGNDHDYPYLQEVNGIRSTSWYRYQALLNCGMRYGDEQNMCDWKYMMPHVANNTQDDRGIAQFNAHQALLLMLMQQFNKDLCASPVNRFYNSYSSALWQNTYINVGQCAFGNADDAGYQRGWSWNNSVVQQIGTGVLPTNGAGEYVYSGERGYPTISEALQVVEPLLRAWWARTSDFVPDDWCREDDTKTLMVRCLSPNTVTPTMGSNYGPANSLQDASIVYRWLGQFGPALGVSYDILADIAAWFDAEWTADPTYLEVIGSPPTAPGIPTLTSPANAATDVALDVTLTWSSVATATNYDVQIDDNAGFTSPATTNVVGGFSYQPNFTTGDEGTTQYWRVRANNGGGSSSYSAARSFTLVSSLYSIRNDQLGEYSVAGSNLTLTDTTGTAIYKLDFGAIADGYRFVVVVDSVSRSANDSTRYNFGVLAIVEDTTDADRPFGAVGASDVALKGFWNPNAAPADSAAKGVFIEPGATPACLGVARTGNALGLEWSYYLGGECVEWNAVAIGTYTVSVPMPATTNYVATIGVRSRTAGEDATGYVRNVYIEAIE